MLAICELERGEAGFGYSPDSLNDRIPARRECTGWLQGLTNVPVEYLVNSLSALHLCCKKPGSHLVQFRT